MDFQVQLADEWFECIQKAMTGRNLGDARVAEAAGLRPEQVRDLRRGKLDREALRQAAPALQLHGEGLLRLAEGTYRPEVDLPPGIHRLAEPFGEGWHVNFWIIADAAGQAVCIDTGLDGRSALDLVRVQSLDVRLLALTHLHRDHVGGLTRLRSSLGPDQAIVPRKEPRSGLRLVSEGDRLTVGELRIDVLDTPGHSPGGTSYLIQGLSVPVVVTGDSLFAGSMGGGVISFDDQYRNIRDKLMPLDPTTIVCPGHGPATTIAYERAHNPFFAEG